MTENDPSIVMPKTQGRKRIYDNVVEAIGNTPPVRVPNYAAKHALKADLLLKLEYFNPLCSVKDRTAVNMILDLEQRG